MTKPIRILVWQWSRLGGPPLFAALLTRALQSLPDVSAFLSLSRQADINDRPDAPKVDLPVDTYRGTAGWLYRLLTIPIAAGSLAARVRVLKPDMAICAQTGPLDLLMGAALRRLGIPYVVIVHDAQAHPGDGYPLVMALQRRLLRSAAAVATLSDHVSAQLRQQDQGRAMRSFIQLQHPPYDFSVPPVQPHDGPLRLLFFGRLLEYKGIDLLTEAIGLLKQRTDFTLRVVGRGPEGAALAALRALPNVSVENRWVPDDEIGALLGWSDALVLPYREASQSGVAAAALAAGRRVVATAVGGLAEQLANRPGAVMCEPSGESLAVGLRRLLETRSAPGLVPEDPDQAWRAFAARLLAASRTVIQPQ